MRCVGVKDGEVRSEGLLVRCDKLQGPVIPRTSLRVWFIRVCSSILLWTCLIQLLTVSELWHSHLISEITSSIYHIGQVQLPIQADKEVPQEPPHFLPPRNYTSNGFLRVSCNGGLNQMRAAICDMVTIARFLNLTLVVPELDKASFWADPSNFEDIFDVNHFIGSLRDEVRIVKRVPKNFGRKYGYSTLMMPPVSWSNEKYYLEQLWVNMDKIKMAQKTSGTSYFSEVAGSQYFYVAMHHGSIRKQSLYSNIGVRLRTSDPSTSMKWGLHWILPLFLKHKVLHFNRTDARLANNGLPLDLQKLRCRVNFQAIKFTPDIENLGQKLIRVLNEKGPFVALHLRYEMDMLAFSGCTQGCTDKEAEELKQMRYAFPWWREKEIVSGERRSQGLCPLTPEEAALVLRALGFDKDTQIYIAAGEIYGGENRLAQLRASFPRIVKKETLLGQEELRQFQNHSSQMAALDFLVSVASDTFIPTYDGNMAKVVEGHRRYSGFKKTILLDRRKLVELIDMHQNGTLQWNEFADAVQQAHESRVARPTRRRVILDKPKEEDYFYANPHECLCEERNCDDLLGHQNSSAI